MHWNELANHPVDNPTKSVPVNDMNKKLKIRRYKNKAKFLHPRNRSWNNNTKGLSKY